MLSIRCRFSGYKSTWLIAPEYLIMRHGSSIADWPVESKMVPGHHRNIAVVNLIQIVLLAKLVDMALSTNELLKLAKLGIIFPGQQWQTIVMVDQTVVLPPFIAIQCQTWHRELLGKMLLLGLRLARLLACLLLQFFVVFISYIFVHPLLHFFHLVWICLHFGQFSLQFSWVNILFVLFVSWRYGVGRLG